MRTWVVSRPFTELMQDGTFDLAMVEAYTRVQTSSLAEHECA